MDQSELKKLSRLDLIELLLEQTKRAEDLERQLAAAQDELKSRELALDRAGSIAQAALEVNGVFEAADAAAKQYKQNVAQLYHKKAEEQYQAWKDKLQAKEQSSEDRSVDRQEETS